MMVLGNVGIPVGTEVVMPIAGALAGTGHLSSVWLAAAVGTLGELVGGSVLYAVGYYGGRPFVARFGRYLKLSEAKLDRFHQFYERYGNVVVFVCRFVPVVRGVSGLPAGVSRMQKRWFLFYTALGSAIFCLGLAELGSEFGHHIDQITPAIHRFSTVAIVALVVVVVAFVGVQLFRSRRGSWKAQ
ncbi:MAG: DedA family protein [Candidatus Eremiobacteraeota bacterium]|nr:DedA family protein [Candidatus Eremiobacteraeota bacterium]